jgi:hypothetical protein
MQKRKDRVGRPAGTPKTGGRKKGTPNRLTRDVSERLEALGCDPIEGMARIAMNPKTKPELRARMFAELAQYVYPKRKATEIAHEESQGGDFTFHELLETFTAATRRSPERLSV